MNALFPNSNFAEAARLERRSFHRAVAAQALATLGGTSRAKPEKILKDTWPRDQRAIELYGLTIKAAVTPTQRSDFPTQSVVESFRSLAPGSAAMALLDRGMKLDLRGSQIIYVPNVTTLPALPVFVAENAAAPSVQWQWGRTQIGPARKILVLSGITGEMEQSSPDNAAAIVGRVLADRTNANIDKVAFSTTADNGTQPQGLLYNVTPITASTSTDQLAALAADLGALVGAIGTASIDPTGVVFVAPPREAMIIAARIGTANASVLMTLGLPNKTVAAFAPAGVISGWRDPPDISTSREALVHEEGQTPLPIGQPGSPNTVAAPARSMFQTNAISIRVRAWAAWACVPGAAQVVNSVNW